MESAGEVFEAAAAREVPQLLQLPALSLASVEPSELVEVRSPNSISMLRGIAVTAADIQNPGMEEHPVIHSTSQNLFSTLLEHRGIQSTSQAPHIRKDETLDDANDEHQRLLIAENILGRLRLRGIHALRKFRLTLHSMDEEGLGVIDGRTFEGALAHMGIRLKPYEFEKMLRFFFVPDSDQAVDYVKLFAFACGNWSEQRHRVVEEAYDVLSRASPGGHVDATAIEKLFDPRSLTLALIPHLIEHEATQEFLRQWCDANLDANGVIRWKDFLDYYHDISLCFFSDQEFCTFVCKSWQINPDDWLAKRIFRKYATEDNPDALPQEEFTQMLHELDPTTTPAEAIAWYKAMDEDHNGEVDLNEFICSKVLKTKRLFDRFDKHGQRSVDKATMVEILGHLSPGISNEDAEAVYCYADLDNNGEVSFCEFLENNLLKLLQIFDDFDRTRTRTYSEADMRQLFRKIDPWLDDNDIRHIYKAIDVDGSGQVSFIEFCESHVLRAHSLFDRHDISRNRSLTQFKFRELLEDLDSNLDPHQMDAIYQLCVDHNTGKVHLGGFLNPNIVKIKMLFDKYDEDRSRYLDGDEFRTMLKDIYKSSSNRDIETIAESVCPVCKTEGISFVSYIQRFGEIARRHEAIQLAKKRRSREKAKSKGLVFVE